MAHPTEVLKKQLSGPAPTVVAQRNRVVACLAKFGPLGLSEGEAQPQGAAGQVFLSGLTPGKTALGL